MQLLQEAQQQMGLALSDTAGEAPCPAAVDADKPRSGIGLAAARCWALLLVRIYECLPLLCPECGEPMRIIAFVLDRPVIDRILRHIGEPAEAPQVWPARGPPQAEFQFDPVDQSAGQDPWPEMDQTDGDRTDIWD